MPFYGPLGRYPFPCPTGILIGLCPGFFFNTDLYSEYKYLQNKNDATKTLHTFQVSLLSLVSHSAVFAPNVQLTLPLMPHSKNAGGQWCHVVTFLCHLMSLSRRVECDTLYFQVCTAVSCKEQILLGGRWRVFVLRPV